MKLRLWSLLIIGLLLLGALPTVAQDTPAAINCLELSEADCAIVTASMENAAAIESFTADFTLSQSSGNTEMAIPGLNTAIDAEGSLAFTIDLGASTEEDPYAPYSMALNATGTLSDEGGEQPLVANIVIVDGNIYMQDDVTGEWRGTSLADLAQQPGAMDVSIMGMSVPMGAVINLGTGMGTANGDAPVSTQTDLMALFQTPGFVTQTRLEDESIGDQNMAVFAYTGDIGTVLSNETIQAELSELATQAGGSDNPMAQQMSAMLPVLLQNTSGEVSLTRWIGMDDQQVHRVELALHVEVDLFGGASGDNTPVPPITFDVNFAADLSALNETAAPVAPEGAVLVPADEFTPQAEPTPEATPAQ